MRICRIILGLIAAAWAVSLVLLLVGTFGLFGQEPDPLAGVFAVILGQPWVRLVDLAPEAAWPWLAALTPGINLALAHVLCRAFHRRTT